MPRAKKQTATASGAAAPPPPPSLGGMPPAPPGMGQPPMPPAVPPPGGMVAHPPLGALGHTVPGAPPPPSIPQQPPAGFAAPGLPAPQPMLPPAQGLPSPGLPGPSAGVDLGPVLAKLDDFSGHINKLPTGLQQVVHQAVNEAMAPLLVKMKELFDLSQTLHNIMMNDYVGNQEQTATAPAPQQGLPAGVDEGTAKQVAQTLKNYAGQNYPIAQLASHFHNTYASQGFPQLTTEVITQIAHVFGIVDANGLVV